MQIMLAATGEATYLVATFRQLFQADPQTVNAPLFSIASRAFSWQGVVAAWRKRFVQVGIKETTFSSHSFQKIVAQYAVNQGMLDENIQ